MCDDRKFVCCETMIVSRFDPRSCSPWIVFSSETRLLSWVYVRVDRFAAVLLEPIKFEPARAVALVFDFAIFVSRLPFLDDISSKCTDSLWSSFLFSLPKDEEGGLVFLAVFRFESIIVLALVGVDVICVMFIRCDEFVSRMCALDDVGVCCCLFRKTLEEKSLVFPLFTDTSYALIDLVCENSESF